MFMTEYNAKKHEEAMKKEWIDEGRAEGEAKERARGMRILVDTLKSLGFASDDIIQKVQENYGLSAKDIAMLL